jgi:hypothetical protein
MPQLDKMNWFFILTLLVLCIALLLVIFIKRNFYSWKKVFLIKNLTTFTTTSVLKQNIFLPFFSIQGLFLQQRKKLFNSFLVAKLPIFSEVLTTLEKSVQKK